MSGAKGTPPAGDAGAPGGPGGAASGPGGGGDAPGRPAASVLMVDDQPANLLALEATLESPDLELCRARSGDEALRLALGRGFDLILLDVQMPGLGGFETADLLKLRPALRATPIIFLSAEPPSPDDLERAKAAGAIDYFAKPLDPAALRAKVRSVLAARLAPSGAPESPARLAPPSAPESPARPAPPSAPESPARLAPPSTTAAAARCAPSSASAGGGAARLRQALASAGLGSWDHDPATGALAWDARGRELGGVADGGGYDAFFARLREGDRATVRRRVAAALDPSSGGAFDAEYRSTGEGGDGGPERRVAAKGQASFENGRAARFVGVVLDVTSGEGAEAERKALLDLGLAIVLHLAESSP